MSQELFGSGSIYATPITDAAGNSIVVPTPVKMLACQDITIDTSFDLKMLHGQNQMPLSVARGKGKINVKAKFGRVSGAMFNNAFFGQTLSTGQDGYNQDLTGAAIPATPFTITPVVPNAGVWSADMGVRNAAGAPMTRVASAPAAGQYSVAAGVYTFADADTGLVVFIDFRYTMTSGKSIVIANQLLGSIPTVSLDIVIPFQGKQLTWKFPRAVAGKMAMATKLDDFTIPELDFDIFADANGTVGSVGLGE